MSQQEAPARRGITFTEVKKKEYPTWGFRPGVSCYPLRMNFMFMNGGMGDYITWFQAVRWLASEVNWIEGGAVIPNYLDELARYWLKPYPEWRILHYSDMRNIPETDTTPYRGPLIINNEALNATGAHLLTCGWVYFTNKEKAPEGIDGSRSKRLGYEVGWDYYPPLFQDDLDQVELPDEAKVLEPKKYAVITTGITTPSREIPGSYWVPVIEHILSKGLTPVFLGKAVVETGNAKNIHTRFSDDIDFTKGVDLRNRTSLMQAASIMSRAAFVIGHDNGLLHLAGCTEAPIIFGYNLASPEHRRPRRPKGPVYDVTLTEKELVCIHCQSKTNFLIGYSFTQCFYRDTKCIHMLFENAGARWKSAIDQALAEGNK